MGLRRHRLVVAGSLDRPLGILKSRGEITRLAIDSEHPQEALSATVTRELVRFPKCVSGLLEILLFEKGLALGERLRHRVGAFLTLDELCERRQEKDGKKEGDASVHCKTIN